MKNFLEEFKKFVMRGNVMDMAVGVIIGGAFTAITSALVANVITPLLAVAFNSPNPDALNITLRAAEGEKEAIVLGLGTLVGAIINFLILALVLFSVIKAMNKAAELSKSKKKKEEEEAAAKAAAEAAAKPTTEELLASILEELKKK
jgi:large conductance mechanosensitive channel